ncbi:MAG: sensor domain-containing diguanylate cyclase [Candidatus Geothermincolia bacterium]
MDETQAECAAKEALYSQDVFREIIDQIGDGVYIVDRDRRIVYWNKGAEEISGFPAAEVIGRRCRDNILVHVDERARPLCFGNCPAETAMREASVVESDVFLHHKAGHRVPIHVRVSPFRSPAGEVVGGIEIFSDNRARLEAQARIEELERLSLLDPLTGIGNRRHAEAYLESRLSEYRRYGWEFGLAFFDIDHFKLVNDTFGHEAGDRVLKMVALTARNSIRTADIASRWGGEEFTAVIQKVDGVILQEITDTMRRLVQESSIDEGGRRVAVTVSVGCTLAVPSDTVESIVARADGLMYASKEAGRNRVTFG